MEPVNWVMDVALPLYLLAVFGGLFLWFAVGEWITARRRKRLRRNGA